MQGFVVAINLGVELLHCALSPAHLNPLPLGRFVGERGLYHPCFGGVECDDSGR